MRARGFETEGCFSTAPWSWRRGHGKFRLSCLRCGKSPPRWKSRGAGARALHCKLVISCLFSKHSWSISLEPRKHRVSTPRSSTRGGCWLSLFWLRPQGLAALPACAAWDVVLIWKESSPCSRKYFSFSNGPNAAQRLRAVQCAAIVPDCPLGGRFVRAIRGIRMRLSIPRY